MASFNALYLLLLWRVYADEGSEYRVPPGYNAYRPQNGLKLKQDPREKSFVDMPNRDGELPATPGSSSQRAVFAASSNCFKSGGGLVPEYYVCRNPSAGSQNIFANQERYCRSDIVQKCLEDLRFNFSRNVHPGCSYEVERVVCTGEPQADNVSTCHVEVLNKSGMQLLGSRTSDEDWKSCCPRFNANDLEAFEASSGYADALFCLKKANCEVVNFTIMIIMIIIFYTACSPVHTQQIISHATKSFHAQGESHYSRLQAECEGRCCHDGSCRYPAGHELEGQLKDEYNMNLFTEGGPCEPSRPPMTASKDPPCFSGDSTVQLRSGETKPFALLAVGDEILSTNAHGRHSFSEVIFLPHGSNRRPTVFARLETESGRSVVATPDHLLVACDGGLVQAMGAKCLRTISGNEVVTSIAKLESRAGIYSAVTLDNEFLIVDGVIASPFATLHAPVHAYYNFHRFIYRYVSPTLLEARLFRDGNALVAVVAYTALDVTTSISAKCNGWWRDLVAVIDASVAKGGLQERSSGIKHFSNIASALLWLSKKSYSSVTGACEWLPQVSERQETACS